MGGPEAKGLVFGLFFFFALVDGCYIVICRSSYYFVCNGTALHHRGVLKYLCI